MSMWDCIIIKDEGDVHHYINNALAVLGLDAATLSKYAEQYDDLRLAAIAERTKTTVNNLTLVRDAIIEQLIK